MRHKKLCQYLKSIQLDCVVICNPDNIRYFSGFTGVGIGLITSFNKLLFTDFRYIEQAKNETKNFEIICYKFKPYEAIIQKIKKYNIYKIGFEDNYMSFNFYKNFSILLDKCNELKPIKLDFLRKNKDRSEIKYIAIAAKIADMSFQYILSKIRPGRREIDIALELEFYMRSQGSEKEAFKTILVSGIRGALPHGAASEKIIRAGEMVTIDFGAVYNGYHSDITRTVIVGKANNKQKEIYYLVLKAQKAGCDAICQGMSTKNVDTLVRKIIKEAGYEAYFGHGLGHGIGLAIHEEPILNQINDTILSRNMYVTIEPGIYLPGWGGVRIEDIIRVDTHSANIITKSSKELIELM